MSTCSHGVWQTKKCWCCNELCWCLCFPLGLNILVFIMRVSPCVPAHTACDKQKSVDVVMNCVDVCVSLWVWTFPLDLSVCIQVWVHVVNLTPCKTLHIQDVRRKKKRGNPVDCDCNLHRRKIQLGAACRAWPRFHSGCSHPWEPNCSDRIEPRQFPVWPLARSARRGFQHDRFGAVAVHVESRPAKWHLHDGSPWSSTCTYVESVRFIPKCAMQVTTIRRTGHPDVNLIMGLDRMGNLLYEKLY